MRIYTEDEKRDALRALDPGVDRETWVSYGMAAHAADLTLDDFIAWSSSAGNFASERDCKDVWRSFSKGGGVGAGTLIYLAKEAGWQPPASPESVPARPQNAAQRPRAPRTRMAEHVDAEAVDEGKTPDPKRVRAMEDVLAAALPASSDHPYLVRKNTWPPGLLEIPLPALSSLLGYTPQQRGVTFTGAAPVLVAPLTDADGRAMTIELIDADGRKAAMAGLPRKGSMFLPGRIDADTPRIGIAEGIATAATCELALDCPVVAAGSCGNLLPVAEALRAKAPGAEILILADAGNGARQAQEAADAVDGICVAPTTDDLPAGKSDWNDVALAHGLEYVQGELGKRSENPRRITFAQARVRAHVEYVLPGLPEGHLGLLVGQGSIGKSFLALELAISIALGRSIMGLDDLLPCGNGGRTTILFGEDDRAIVQNRMHSIMQLVGFSDRERALLDERMRVMSLAGDDLRVVQTEARTLSTGAFAEKLYRHCHGQRLVFVDPLIRLHDADENDNSAAAHLMLILARIARDTKCAIVLLHHVGKGDRGGWQAARGASAIVTSVRWQMNMSPPSPEDIERHSLSEAAADLFVKVGGVKMNYAERRVDSFWLKRHAGGVLLHAPEGPLNEVSPLDAFQEADTFSGAAARSSRLPGAFRQP